MSITDELRKYATVSWNPWPEARDRLLQMCDRIDAEHERQLEVLYRDMSDAEYVKLPKDADGEPIHIGDVLQWPEDGDTFEVIGIGEDGVLFYFDPDTDGETADWTASQNKRHYHAPTVVDVLREFAEKVIDSQIPSVHPTYEEAITEYAAKLRLVDDRKEQ